MRFLPNPFFIPHLKDKSGADTEVKDFVLTQADAQEFLENYLRTLAFLITKHAEAGKLYLNIGLGCTGGRHRSVVLAKELADRLQSSLSNERFSISVRNRDILKAE